MKVTGEHLANIKQAFSETFTQVQLADHMKAYADAGYTERRARFDAFWAVNKRSQLLKDTVRSIYEYANDDHLYTALKQVL